MAGMETAIAPGSPVTDAELERLGAAIRDAEPSFLADFERLVNVDCGATRPRASTRSEVRGRLPVRPRRRGGGPAGPVRPVRFDGRLRASSGPRVVLIGHMDTVFDPGTAAERPFRSTPTAPTARASAT